MMQSHVEAELQSAQAEAVPAGQPFNALIETGSDSLIMIRQPLMLTRLEALTRHNGAAAATMLQGMPDVLTAAYAARCITCRTEVVMLGFPCSK